MNIYKINKYAVVSFDIFDTLLKRHVRKPEDVFVLVERSYNNESGENLSGFPEKRIAAEKKARSESGREDVDIYEIYSYIDYNDKSRLLELELEIEDALLVPNKEIKKVFDFAVSSGKRVIIISDMYLPKEFLEKVLKKNGFNGYERLFVSSELGMLKSSGTMYDYVLSFLNVKANTILHIGDALKGDFLIPRLKGIDAFLLKTYVNNGIYNYTKRNDSLERRLLTSFINNNESNENENRINKIGFETLGPLLYGFCQWIHKKKTDLGLNKLLFFARDGQLVYDCYKKMFPNDLSEYVYFSRRSLSVPLICKLKDKKDVLSTIPINRYTEISSVISRLGISYDNNLEQIESCGFKKGQSFHRDFYLEDEKFDRLYNLLLPQIIENSKMEFLGLSSYFNRLDCTGLIGLVDLGWKGTIQNAFEKFVDIIGAEISVQGLYIGIMRDASNCNGYIYQSDDKKNEDSIMSFSGLVETVFSADHGSVLSYDSNGNVRFCPFEYEFDEKARREYSSIVEVQKGARDFVFKLMNSPFINKIVYSKECLYENIKRLGTTPCLKDVLFFGDFYFFDTHIVSLAKPSFGIGYRMIKNVITDFSNSSWKIGYLKRFFKINMSYINVYSFLKKIVNR